MMKLFRMSAAAIVLAAGFVAISMASAEARPAKQRGWTCTSWTNVQTTSGKSQRQCHQWTYSAATQSGVTPPPFAATGDGKGRARGQSRRSRSN